MANTGIYITDTIVALATPQGAGAIAIIRLSGNNTFQILETVFYQKKQAFNAQKTPSHSAHLGFIKKENTIVDEVLVTIFKNPSSYTGEDVAEIACHGSTYVQQEILNLLLQKGARLANPGEFTQRAFLNRKLDLSQAEAVADLIASENQAQHQIAMNQMRGGFSSEINTLREELINFAALIELELDFSEEDVEFADRKQFLDLIQKIKTIIQHLIDSFAYGNVIKEGVPVAIIGKPNAGKSSLLNALLNEERAIVSDVPGTTRDTIEDTLVMQGIKFRFIDTAGIRQTQDAIEAIGVQKAKEKAAQAKVVLYLFSEEDNTAQEVINTALDLYREDAVLILLENKIDLKGGFFENEFNQTIQNKLFDEGITQSYFAISAHQSPSVESVKNTLLDVVKSLASDSNIVVTNTRHKDALEQSLQSLQQVEQGLHDQLSGDLLAMDIREALHHLGKITGAIEVDKDILGAVFSRFCIGK